MEIVIELVPHERLHHTDKFDDPNLPGQMYKIWVEIEQKFFGGDAARFSQPPYIGLTHPEG
jgi:hypothetical protein